jgi:protein SCO1
VKSSSRAVFVTRVLIAALASAHANQGDSQDDGGLQKVNRELHGWPVGDFTLVDQDRRIFTQERLQGRWTFVLLGDTRCGEPRTAALLAGTGMCRHIARTEVVRTTQMLFVSLDPERDMPEQLRRYLTPFGENIIGASGTRQSLTHLIDDLSFSGPARTQPGEYRGSLLLIGPDGIVRGELLPPFDVPLLTACFLKMRIGR